MSDDVPTGDKDPKERGRYARHAGDPTLASYLSSLLFLSVPVYIGVAYAGYLLDVWPYSWILPVFGGLLAGTIALAFALMHVLTGG